MVWYIVIAVIVGLVAAFVVGLSLMNVMTYDDPEFFDFFMALLVGVIAGAFIGGFWLFSLPILGIIYGLWRLYLASQKSAKRKKSNSFDYSRPPLEKTEKRTGIKALFKW